MVREELGPLKYSMIIGNGERLGLGWTIRQLSESTVDKTG